jgi:hypothetical protein
MKQYRYLSEEGSRKPECQWNGPSWPFQTTLALGGLANLLNDNPYQGIINAGDYLRLLRQYTNQHYLNGKPDLQEDYDPDTGKAIVGLQRSHHYNHSAYNDLIITGLVGLRPRPDQVLEVNPLLSGNTKDGPPLTWFCLENVLYHGRLVTILYDRDGTHFRRGAGLSVYVDGRILVKPSVLGRKVVPLPPGGTPVRPLVSAVANLAVNLSRTGFPAPSASVKGNPRDLYAAIDGRVWFYPEVRNYWTNAGSQNASDWYSLDFGKQQNVNKVTLAFYADGKQFKPPGGAQIQVWSGQDWQDVSTPRASPSTPPANGEMTITFNAIETSRLRVLFENPRNASIALVEMKVYGDVLVNARPLLDTSHVSGMPLRLEGLQEENSRTGEFSGVRWRDAVNGGYFAFELAVQPSVENALVVTYWGSDAGNRRFDILVNGTRIAGQVLENNRPGEFFDVTYPIPAAVSQGKNRVTVRFQAKPGATAGGVFGVHIMRRATASR